MAIQSKETIKTSLIESARRLQKVRQRGDAERSTQSLQEAEPRTPPQVELTRK